MVPPTYFAWNKSVGRIPASESYCPYVFHIRSGSELPPVRHLKLLPIAK